MQQLLNICQNYAANHQLLYNGAKSFSLCFKNNAIKIKQQSFYLAHLKIPIVKNYKYLGITISMKRQMRKIYANANLLLKKFSSSSDSVKCYLFKTYCFTLLCARMWLDCTKTVLKKLKVAYNSSLRRFMRLPWRNSAIEMFVNLNIRSFDEMLRIFTFRFMSRVIVSNNVLISSIYNSLCRLYSNILSWWDSLLHINRVNL